MTNKVKRKRTVTKVTCQLCNGEFSGVGMATHLRDSHDGMIVDEYVNRFGEFRINKLRASNLRDQAKHQDTCRICNDGVIYSDRALAFHIIKTHNMPKRDYLIKYIFENKIPTCECGCGEQVKILDQFPYYRSYLSGHNARGTLNPRYGQPIDPETRKKMKEKALERVKHYQETGETLPMHTPAAILKRRRKKIDQ